MSQSTPTIRRASSGAVDPGTAIAEMRAALEPETAALVAIFVSNEYELPLLAR